jgi:hypothetical protein
MIGALNGEPEAMTERSTIQRIGDVEQMVTSFRRHLRAENKADQTVMAYTYAPLQLAAFLADRGMPADVASIHREHIEAFLEDLRERRSAATANNRYRGLVAFFSWLAEEGEVPSSPMARMKPPSIPQQPVPIPSTAHPGDPQGLRRQRLRGPARRRDHPSVRRLGGPARRARRSPTRRRGRLRRRPRLGPRPRPREGAAFPHRELRQSDSVILEPLSFRRAARIPPPGVVESRKGRARSRIRRGRRSEL